MLQYGYGIHGTDDEESIGKAVSHGCIRMRNRDIEQLYPEVPVGTGVNIIGQVFTGRMLIPGESSGTDVRAVQELLTMLGYYQGDVSGVYDADSAAAVRRFQAQQGLAPDGIVGPLTYDALLREFTIERGITSP